MNFAAVSHDEHIRPTRAEIDLSALLHNLVVVRGQARVPVFAVVKADAYGHGLVPVATKLAEGGVDGLCVALVEEALRLRDAGIETPIVVLNGIYGGAHQEVLEAGLTPVVYDLADIEAFARAPRADVHLKVDTGMHRLGIPARELSRFLDGLARFPNVRVTGLMSHLSAAESDEAETAAQLERFYDARRRIEERGHRPTSIHIANSAGALLREATGATMVRAGVALYGVPPRPELDFDLRPVMRVVTGVVRVATVEAGGHVGYNGTFTAEKDTRVATLAIGYGDGLMRHLSNRGSVLIRGARCPIAGSVSMDLTGVDVSALETCERGDEAVILGEQGEGRLTADELAAWAGTIPYEILTSIAPRVPRVYLDEP